MLKVERPDPDTLVLVEEDGRTAHVLTRDPAPGEVRFKDLHDTVDALGLDTDALVRVGAGHVVPEQKAPSVDTPGEPDSPQPMQDDVDAALVATFPASDPPSFTPGVA